MLFVSNIHYSMWQIQDSSVDFAYTYQVLPHFESGNRERERALSDIARVLSPGGVALIEDYMNLRQLTMFFFKEKRETAWKKVWLLWGAVTGLF